MTEFKRNFTSGRMNKDLDERLVPNGEYREALNVEVTTSEGSDIGTVQTTLGNTQVFGNGGDQLATPAQCIGSIASDSTNKLYYLVASPPQNPNDPFPWANTTNLSSNENANQLFVDFISEYDVVQRKTVAPVIVDVHTVRLKYYETDVQNGVNNTIFNHVNTDTTGIYIGQRVYTKTPASDPNNPNTIWKGTVEAVAPNTFIIVKWDGDGLVPYPLDAWSLEYGLSSDPGEGFLEFTNPFGRVLHFSGRGNRVKLWPLVTGINIIDDMIYWTDNYTEPKKINITRSKQGSTDYYTHTHLWVDGIDRGLIEEEHITVIRRGPALPPTIEMSNSLRDGIINSTSTITTGVISTFDDIIITLDTTANFNVGDTLLLDDGSVDDKIRVIINTINGLILECTIILVDPTAPTGSTNWNVTLDQETPMYELKFPRFAYRYKYEDGEYSTMSPFSEVAFIPGEFDYLPKKGYNLGMTNNVRSLKIKDWVPKNVPLDVVKVDILYKETNSANIYTIKHIKRFSNEWNASATGSNTGVLNIEKELVNAVIPSNQLLRPWDNVPRRALAQEISANRLIFGNYLQNYDIDDTAEIEVSLVNNTENTFGRSVKSLRNYQLGIIYKDFYGRETPILTHNTSALKVSKVTAPLPSKIEAKVLSSPPSWASSYKFFIKETSNEYYNIAVDRWYNAEDGNVWLSVPSEHRNKIDDETVLIPKKEHDGGNFIVEDNKYKVLAIKNEAPDFIKTTLRTYGILADDSTTGSFGTPGVLVSDGLPIANTNKIWIKFAAWQGSEISDAKEFGDSVAEAVGPTKDNLIVRIKKTTGEISKWYNISSIAGSDNPLNLSGQSTTTTGEIVVITIDEPFEDTLTWTSPSIPPVPSNPVVGLSIEIAEKVIESKAEFDGRFFIKILNDEVIRKYIITTFTPSTNFYEVGNLGVTYLNGAKRDTATDAGGNTVALLNNHPSGADGTLTGIGKYVDDGSTLFLDDDHAKYWATWGEGSSSQYRFHGFDDTFGGVYLDPGQTSSSTDYLQGMCTGPACYTPGVYSEAPYADIDNYGGPSYYNRKKEEWIAITSQTHLAAETDPENPWNTSEYYGWVFFIDAEPTFSKHSCVSQMGQTSLNNYTDYQRNYENIPGVGAEPGSNRIDISFVSERDWSGCDEGGSLSDPALHSTATALIDANIKAGKYFMFRSDPNNTIYKMVTINKVWYRNHPWYTYASGGPGGCSPSYHETGWWGYYGFSDGCDKTHSAKRFRYEITLDKELGIIDDGLGNVTYDGYVPTYWNGAAGTYKTNYNTSQGFDRTDLAKHAFYNNSNDSYNFIDIVFLDGVDTLENKPEMSTNPAVFETEPREYVELDIYHEVGQAYPLTLTQKTNEEYIPIGSTVVGLVNQYGNNPIPIGTKVIGWVDARYPNENVIVFDNGVATGMFQLQPGDEILFLRPDGSYTTALFNGEANSSTWPGSPGYHQYFLIADVSNQRVSLPWHNCYTFGNGVESDRIRDLFNEVTIDNGPKVSTGSELYKQERRKTGLIYSGIFNSRSGLNNLNQFIQAEKITKDINPEYGSIQKLHTRDTNLITLCEDKILRILADKDAIFNADGNTQLTATSKVLGEAIPYVGEFGISRNPESFASESFRAYFADKQRGAVLRLSQDGLTEISKAGMEDYFRDEFQNLEEGMAHYGVRLLGTYDDRKNLYNLTSLVSSANVPWTEHVQVPIYSPKKTVSFSENTKGWVSFKSFIPQQGLSINNQYYTWNDSELYQHHAEIGMNIYGVWGVPVDRNKFYGIQYDSFLNVLINDLPGSIKSFNTVNYEGSQAEIIENHDDGEYFNTIGHNGWYINTLITDLQRVGNIHFKEKEGKWFSYIKGNVEVFNTKPGGEVTSTNLDTKEFSTQGIGEWTLQEVAIEGCMDTTTGAWYPDVNGDCPEGVDENWGYCMGLGGYIADNYNPAAVMSDGSCNYPVTLIAFDERDNMVTSDADHPFPSTLSPLIDSVGAFRVIVQGGAAPLSMSYTANTLGNDGTNVSIPKVGVIPMTQHYTGYWEAEVDGLCLGTISWDIVDANGVNQLSGSGEIFSNIEGYESGQGGYYSGCTNLSNGCDETWGYVTGCISAPPPNGTFQGRYTANTDCGGNIVGTTEYYNAGPWGDESCCCGGCN